MLIAGGGAVALFALAKFIPALNLPRDLEFSPARSMNESLTYLIVNFRTEIETIKTLAFFFIMLPTKIGLQGSVSPFTWGLSCRHGIRLPMPSE